jgi:hypothetical protein
MVLVIKTAAVKISVKENAAESRKPVSLILE